MLWSQSTFYGVGVSQLAIMFGVVLFFPMASVQVYSYSPCVANGTLTHSCGATHPLRIMLPLPCLAVCAAVSAYVSNTFSLGQTELLSEESPYGPESLGQTGLWNALFWFVVTGAHGIVLAAACSPVDVFAWALATYLCVSFLARICAPAEQHGMDGPVSTAVTIANANVLGYMAGVCVAGYCVPQQYSNRFILLFLTVVLDYFLGVGHTWDRSPSMATIGNCRLFWSCSTALCLAALYGAWRDDLLLPSDTQETSYLDD